MAPKQKVNKKTEEKRKDKIIEDKTFGLKVPAAAAAAAHCCRGCAWRVDSWCDVVAPR
jgi:hypothetical protein